jgi:hypothetical protein
MKRITMISILLAAVIILPVIAPACTYGQISVPLNTQFTLPITKTAVISGEQLRIKFVDVTADSRCPTGVECPQAGKAECQMLVFYQDAETKVTLTQTGGNESNKVTYNGYTISFRLEPYPVSGQKINDDDYKLIMMVIK